MEVVIRGDTYSVERQAGTGTVALKGCLRLNGLQEYAPIADALRQAGTDGRPVVLDLRGLEFLNSSGIAMLSKFVIEARNGEVPLTIVGTRAVAWQTKSLINLQRLMPALALEFS